MTRTPTTARPTVTTISTRRDRAATEQMLRDMAFVLQMTQRIKNEIVAEKTTDDVIFA